jgi:hypothetical protein
MVLTTGYTATADGYHADFESPQVAEIDQTTNALGPEYLLGPSARPLTSFLKSGWWELGYAQTPNRTAASNPTPMPALP